MSEKPVKYLALIQTETGEITRRDCGCLWINDRIDDICITTTIRHDLEEISVVLIKHNFAKALFREREVKEKQKDEKDEDEDKKEHIMIKFNDGKEIMSYIGLELPLPDGNIGIVTYDDKKCLVVTCPDGSVISMWKTWLTDEDKQHPAFDLLLCQYLSKSVQRRIQETRRIMNLRVNDYITTELFLYENIRYSVRLYNNENQIETATHSKTLLMYDSENSIPLFVPEWRIQDIIMTIYMKKIE